MTSTILAILLSFPVCWADRDTSGKRDQLETIVQAIAAEASGPDEAAMLLAIGWWESRWCLRVHSGEHRGPGRGLWQLEGHGEPTGLSLHETRAAARAALGVLRRSWQCGPTPASRLTAYAGRRCHEAWPTLWGRVKTYRWAIYQINGSIR